MIINFEKKMALPISAPTFLNKPSLANVNDILKIEDTVMDDQNEEGIKSSTSEF